MPVCVDVHSHVYSATYMEMLRKRTEVPRILPGATLDGPERLLILPSEDQVASTTSGRPVGAEYFDIAEKLAFMDRHDIDHSVVSLANPWLDWCDKREAQVAAREINAELLQWCTSPASQGRLSFFAVLPSPCVESCVSEIERLAGNDHVKGCILGTRGAGKGLDDRALDPMWAALEKAGWMAFVHPHYHLPTEVYGEQENGHVLYVAMTLPKLRDAYIRPLAFGFPVETSLAISRLILAGVMERFPDLKLLIAHSGGVLPFLAGRLDSCVAHDRHVSERLSHPPSVYLSQLYYDAVSYQPASLQCTKALLGGSSDKLLFGTDHPFFPPLSDSGATGPDLWESAVGNKRAISEAFTNADAEGVLGLNAMRIFGLRLPQSGSE